MNELDIKNIVKYGIESPSAGFTDELIKKISAECNIIKRTRTVILLLALGCLTCSFLLLIIMLPEFVIFGYTFELSPVIIQVPGVLFILYQISQIVRIHELVTKINQLNLTNNMVWQYD